MKLFLVVSIFTIGVFASMGEDVFSQKCSSCHSYYIKKSRLLKNFKDENNSLNLKAPTINQLSFLLKNKIGNRRGDIDSQMFEVEEFISNYLDNPLKENSILPNYISKYFKTKSCNKTKLTQEEKDEVSDYIYEYGENAIRENSVKRYSYKKALEIAKKENKIVLIQGYIRYCKYCIKMDREVFVEDDVKEVLNKDFVFVKKDLIVEKLPLGMPRLSTPAFYFISKDEKILEMLNGFGTSKEFIELLTYVKNSSK